MAKCTRLKLFKKILPFIVFGVLHISFLGYNLYLYSENYSSQLQVQKNNVIIDKLEKKNQQQRMEISELTTYERLKKEADKLGLVQVKKYRI